jgi:hypothetical protein
MFEDICCRDSVVNLIIICLKNFELLLKFSLKSPTTVLIQRNIDGGLVPVDANRPPPKFERMKMIEDRQTSTEKGPGSNFGNGIGVGIALGVAFGAVYGATSGDMGQSLAMGVALGTAFGAVFDWTQRGKSKPKNNGA